MDRISEIQKLLSLNSSLIEKARGFNLAGKIDSPEVNDALVLMLSDESKGGRISRDEGLEKPWIEAMHLLVIRFPESGIKADPDYKYTLEDKNDWLKWWLANKMRIEYQGDGTHRLLPKAAFDPKASGAADVVSPQHSSSVVQNTMQPKSPPTVQLSVGKTSFETKLTTASDEQPASRKWFVCGVMIVVAIGLFLLLKNRK